MGRKRTLPADAELIRLFGSGVSCEAIAARYGAKTKTVEVFRRRLVGLRRVARLPSVTPTAPKRSYPVPTAEKVVVEVNTYEGLFERQKTLFISLPRIPSVHGHFEGA